MMNNIKKTNTMETQQNNKLIRDFIPELEVKFCDYNGEILINIKELSINNLEFHKSWDWLMPVIEKIESLGYFVMINKWTSVYEDEKRRTIGDLNFLINKEKGSKIENTYKAVVEFIKWYNNKG